MRRSLTILLFFLVSCTTIKIVTLDGSASYDPDGTIVKYQWRQIQGPSFPVQSPTSVITSTKIKSGKYAWELTVWDNQGAEGRDTTIINN